jgi:hypothetical protein
MDNTIVLNKELLLKSKHIRWKVLVDYIEYIDVETNTLIMVTPRVKGKVIFEDIN